MKRFFIITPVLLVIIVAAAFFVLTNPSIQKKYALGALQEKDSSAKLKYLAVDTDSIELEGVSFTQNGNLIELRQLTLDYSLTSLVFGSQINIEKLKANGLKLDMTNQQPTEEEAKESKARSSEPFQGIFKALEDIGIELSLGSVDVDAEVILQNGVVMALDINGGGIQNSNDGEIRYNIKFRYPGQAVGESDLGGSGSLIISMDDKSRIKAFKMDTNLSSFGLLMQSRLHQNSDATGESYSVDIKSVDSNSSLISLSSDYSYSGSTLNANYNVDLVRDQVLPFLSTFSKGVSSADELPDFTLQAKGNAQLDINTASGKSNISSALRLPNPAQMDESLQPLGAVTLQTQTDVDFSKTQISLNNLESSLLAEQLSEPLLDIKSSQSFVIPLGSNLDASLIPNGDLIKALFNVPLVLGEPFLPGIDITGGHFVGDLNMQARDGVFTLASTDMLEIIGLNSNQNGEKRLVDFGVSLKPQVEFNGKELLMELNEIHLFGLSQFIGKGRIGITAEMNDGQMELQTVRGTQMLDLEGMLTQPVMSDTSVVFTNMSPRFNTDYELRLDGETLIVDNMSCSVSSESTKLFDVELLQVLSVPLDGDLPNLKSYTGDIVRVNSRGFPLETVSPFIADMDLKGVINNISAVISADGTGITFRTEDAVNMAGLSVSHKDKLYVSALETAFTGVLKYAEDKIVASISNLNLSSRGVGLLAANAKLDYRMATGDIPDANVNLNCDLASLMNQPFMSDFQNMETGMLKMNMSLDSTKENNAIISMKLDNIKAVGSEPTGGMNLNYEGSLNLKEIAMKGRAAVEVRGSVGVSDLQLDIDYNPENLNYSLSGNNVHIDDVNLISEAFKSDQEDSGVEGEDEMELDESPFWPAINGKGQISIAELTVAENQVRNISGSQSISHNVLDVETLTAEYVGAPVQLNGRFTFEDGSPEPYGFNGSIGITDLSLGRALKIDKWVDGLYSFNGDINGRGRNMTHLFKLAKGNVALNSKEGELTFFNLKELLSDGSLGSFGKVLGGVVNGASQGLDILSSITGGIGQGVSNKIKRYDYINKLLRYFQKMKFYKLEIGISRGDNLDLVFDTIEVLGPESSLNGSGIVKYQPGVELIDQPLRLDLALGAKGAVADLLSKVGSINDAPQEDGFYEAYKFPIKGTLSEPDWKELIYPILESQSNLISNNIKVLKNTNAGSRETQQDSGNNNSGTGQAPPKKVGVEDALNNIIKGFF